MRYVLCTALEKIVGVQDLFAAKVAKRVTDVGVKGGTSMRGGSRGVRGGGMQGRGRDLWNLGGMSCWWSGKSQESLGQNGGRKRDQRSE